jgi:hypothetical protein
MTAPGQQEQAPKWSAVLDVQDPDGTRTRHPFRHPRVAVGRKHDNDLSLSDEGVSHQHCEFVSEQGFFVVRDLGSQNGTWLNDHRVEEAKLRDGDEVRIGATRIRIALEGKVKIPERRRRLRGIGIGLGFLAAIGIWVALAMRQDEVRKGYAAALREESAADDPCHAPQLAQLDAIDAQLGGRSVALTLDRGQIKLTKADEALDRELLGLYQRKVALDQEAFHALVVGQEQRRDALEKLSRAGQRMWTERERRTAAWADGLFQERVQAVDELMSSLKQAADDTTDLTIALQGVLAQPPDKSQADRLQKFRFKADLRVARTACELRSARAGASLSGALTALSE